MNDIITLREEKDGYIFVELNAVLQKYLGRASEKIARKICKIVELILDGAYNYGYILRDESEYDCSHIAEKKRIRRYDERLSTEICQLLHKYLHNEVNPTDSQIRRIIEMILDMQGYKKKTMK
jgi:translation elongation factor EF-Ts